MFFNYNWKCFIRSIFIRYLFYSSGSNGYWNALYPIYHTPINNFFFRKRKTISYLGLFDKVANNLIVISVFILIYIFIMGLLLYFGRDHTAKSDEFFASGLNFILYSFYNAQHTLLCRYVYLEVLKPSYKEKYWILLIWIAFLLLFPSCFLHYHKLTQL